MNMVRRIVIGLAGVVVVALAIEIAAPKAVHALVATAVDVVNTPNVIVANTVPVTGNVNANVNGTVAVSSMPAVAIGGNVNATVSDPLDGSGNPVPLVTREQQNPADEPYFNSIETDGGSFVVPSTTSDGKSVERLVITFISAFAISSSQPAVLYLDVVTQATNSSGCTAFGGAGQCLQIAALPWQPGASLSGTLLTGQLSISN
jgi:hypothetical protein